MKKGCWSGKYGKYAETQPRLGINIFFTGGHRTDSINSMGLKCNMTEQQVSLTHGDMGPVLVFIMASCWTLVRVRLLWASSSIKSKETFIWRVHKEKLAKHQALIDLSLNCNGDNEDDSDEDWSQPAIPPGYLWKMKYLWFPLML